MTGSFTSWGRRQFMQAAGLITAARLAMRDAVRDGYAAGSPVGGVYGRLGIRPLINAAGTYTMLSACTMPREVVQAMEEASRSHVALAELRGRRSRP